MFMSASHNIETNHVHDHVFLGSAHEENAKRTLWVVALTVAMMIGEIAAGYITGSMALLADGFHMATHAGALGCSSLWKAGSRSQSPDGRVSTGLIHRLRTIDTSQESFNVTRET
jgi:Co/Zn/Cd efflux system component